VGSGAGQDRR
jgi:hypothetical protein